MFTLKVGLRVNTFKVGPGESQVDYSGLEGGAVEPGATLGARRHSRVLGDTHKVPPAGAAAARLRQRGAPLSLRGARTGRALRRRAAYAH